MLAVNKPLLFRKCVPPPQIFTHPFDKPHLATTKILVKPSSTGQRPWNCGSTFVWLKFCCTAPNSEAKSAKSLWGGGGKRAWRNTYSLLKQRRSKRQNNVSQTCSAAHTWAISSHTTSVFIWHVACNCFLSSLLHNLIGNPYSSIIRASGNHKSGHNVSSTPKW